MSQLKLGSERIDKTGTKSLRALKKLPARYRGDLEGALMCAARSAKKNGIKMYVYESNSYGYGVWRVSYDKTEYLNKINNTGDKLAAVTPDLTMSWFDIERPPWFYGKNE